MDVYALTMVMLYCSRRGHQYPFLVAFLLRNLPTLFILNNENDKFLAVFRKNGGGKCHVEFSLVSSYPRLLIYDPEHLA
jgi:hypothetical protein